MKSVILASARKHGITDEDMLHAFRNPIRIIDQDDITVLIGPDAHGNLLEIALVQKFRRLEIVHAMKARSRYLM